MSNGNYRRVRSVATHDPSERVPAVVPVGPTAKAVRLVREGCPSVVVPLATSRDYVVGRSEEADLYFGHESVSRHHGSLYFSAEAFAWTFRDAASRNGTLFFMIEAQQTERVRPGQLVAVAAGCSLQVGNSPGNRLEFLAEIPEEALGAARVKWKSAAARKLEEQIQTASQHPMPVLLLGPKGAGKTSAATRIHQLSGLRGDYVELNCAHLPSDRVHLRSELLGHVKGAFTGANDPREGRLFQADGGTLFLDEVESMVEEAQAFLLNLLEGRGDLAPLGANPSKRRPPPKYRLISASKRPLSPPGFREDLAERLVGDIIIIPTLAERREDIPAFVAMALERLAAEQQLVAEVSPDAIAYLTEQPWPGQVRELLDSVRVVAFRRRAEQARDGHSNERLTLGVEQFRAYLGERRLGLAGRAGPVSATTQRDEGSSVTFHKRPKDLTREEVSSALRGAAGNKTRAAKLLGIAIGTLKRKMGEFGL